MPMELTYGSILERATRLDIGSGLQLTQSADGLPQLSLDYTADDTRYVLKAGDTMTGALTAPGAPAFIASHATDAAYKILRGAISTFFESYATSASAFIYHNGSTRIEMFDAGGGTLYGATWTLTHTATAYLVVNSPVGSDAGIQFQEGGVTKWYTYRVASSPANAWQVYSASFGAVFQLDYSTGLAHFYGPLSVVGSSTFSATATINPPTGSNGLVINAVQVNAGANAGATAGGLLVDNKHGSLGNAIATFYNSGGIDAQFQIFPYASQTMGLQATKYSSGAIRGLYIQPYGGAVTIGSASVPTALTVTSLLTILGDAENSLSQAATAGAALYRSFYNSAGTRRGYYGYESASSSLFVIHNAEAGDVVIRANGSERIRALSAGGVTVTDPLTVTGEMHITGRNDLWFYNANASSGQRWAVRIKSDAESGTVTGSNLEWVAYDNTGVFVDSMMKLTRTGNLIFNASSFTITPQGQFVLCNQHSYTGNAGNAATYTSTSGAVGQAVFNSYYAANSDGLGTFPRYLDIVCIGSPDGSSGGSNIRFLTHPITTSAALVLRMLIRSDGRVGIGTASPATLLHVAGSFQADGGHFTQNIVADANINFTAQGNQYFIPATAADLVYRSANAGSAALRLDSSSPVTYGYLYGDSTGAGILDSARSWKVQATTAGGTLYGAWSVTGAITIPSTSYFLGNVANGYRFNDAASSNNLVIIYDDGRFASMYGGADRIRTSSAGGTLSLAWSVTGAFSAASASFGGYVAATIRSGDSGTAIPTLDANQVYFVYA